VGGSVRFRTLFKGLKTMRAPSIQNCQASCACKTLSACNNKLVGLDAKSTACRQESPRLPDEVKLINSLHFADNTKDEDGPNALTSNTLFVKSTYIDHLLTLIDTPFLFNAFYSEK
jgi:hypothetical protein